MGKENYMMKRRSLESTIRAIVRREVKSALQPIKTKRLLHEKPAQELYVPDPDMYTDKQDGPYPYVEAARALRAELAPPNAACNARAGFYKARIPNLPDNITAGDWARAYYHPAEFIDIEDRDKLALWFAAAFQAGYDLRKEQERQHGNDIQVVR